MTNLSDLIASPDGSRLRQQARRAEAFIRRARLTIWWERVWLALGDVYSTAMGAHYLDADGRSQVMQMGCYGIGVTRVVAAAIEQNHDERGIVWPFAMAPFAVAIAPIGYDRSDTVRDCADRLHQQLVDAGIEVLLDDRGERPGVMFADLELIGIPHRVTIGERGLKEGIVEYQARRGAAVTKLPLADTLSFLNERIGT